MNENITYFQAVETRPTSYTNGQPNGTIQYESQPVEFHSTSVGQFHTTSANQFHSGGNERLLVRLVCQNFDIKNKDSKLSIYI
jgi:hypothetical protein